MNIKELLRSDKDFPIELYIVDMGDLKVDPASFEEK